MLFRLDRGWVEFFEKPATSAQSAFRLYRTKEMNTCVSTSLLRKPKLKLDVHVDREQKRLWESH
jgi:hypothetical protein